MSKIKEVKQDELAKIISVAMNYGEFSTEEPADDGEFYPKPDENNITISQVIARKICENFYDETIKFIRT